MLKFEVDSLDGIEDSVRGLYEQRGDKYRLKVEGIDPADELKEALRKEREERKAAKERADTLEQAQRTAEEERAKQAGQFKELFEREQKEKRDLADKLAAFMAETQRDKIAIATAQIAGQLAKDGDRARLLAEQAEKFAKFNEGAVIFEIGGVAVDQEKLIGHLKEKYPFLVDASGANGGGAPSSGSSGGAAKNPFAKGESFNLTEQARITRENPQLAAQLKQAASR